MFEGREFAVFENAQVRHVSVQSASQQIAWLGERLTDLLQNGYLLRNGSNPSGVQREIEQIIPEIEALLEELKKAIKEERERSGPPKGQQSN